MLDGIVIAQVLDIVNLGMVAALVHMVVDFVVLLLDVIVTNVVEFTQLVHCS